MIRITLLVAYWAIISRTFGQIYSDKAAYIRFFSEAPLENIEAINQKASAILSTEKNNVAFSIQIKDFHFEKALMEEHFNENYMESEKFPKSTFSGKINETVTYNKPGKYDVTVTGKLVIHGVEQTRTIPGQIIVQPDGKIGIESKFKVKLEDHQIKIPRALFKNIAEEVEVTVKSKLSPQK
ncbi:MAG: YceI family protein [Bacteroidia bacterium]|nr:YceI family protein [Bacteroidia bacterium]